MLALFLKISLLLFASFTFYIGFIRAQPYDDNEVRALLASESGCPMPCFIGIRPGVTTCDQAITLLKNHEWVGEITADPCSLDGESYRWISWYWNGRQPDVLADSHMLPNNLRMENNVVRELQILTFIPVAEVWIFYGPPDLKTVDVVSEAIGPTRILNGAGYSQMGLELTSYSPCPGSYKDFWAAPTVITLTSQPQGLSNSPAEFAALLVYHNQLCRG